MARVRDNRTPQQTAKPSHPLTPYEDFERWVDEAFPMAWMHRRGWPSWGELTTPADRLLPRVDVVDRDDEIVLRAEVPGVKKDDLEVSVTEDSVLIKGHTKEETKEEKGEFFRCEIAQGAFTRTVQLPGAVNPDEAKASFDEGVLELKMPKLGEAKRRTVKLN